MSIYYCICCIQEVIPCFEVGVVTSDIGMVFFDIGVAIVVATVPEISIVVGVADLAAENKTR